jgi:AcrR family transcriptional regulator
MSAAERREAILAAAIDRFGTGGYAGTPTDAIASDAGISQPYLFRLFSTKRELFLACYDRVVQRIQATFAQAAEGVPPEERFVAMGTAYIGLLDDRTLLRFLLQAYAATADASVQAHVRDRYRELVAWVTETTGGAPPDIWRFFANGMLLNLVASLDLQAIAPQDEWAAAWCEPAALIAGEQAG